MVKGCRSDMGWSKTSASRFTMRLTTGWKPSSREEVKKYHRQKLNQNRWIIGIINSWQAHIILLESRCKLRKLKQILGIMKKWNYSGWIFIFWSITCLLFSSIGKFLGGDKPNLADLAVYGALSAVEGCEAFLDLQVREQITNHYFTSKHISLKA